MSEFRTTSSPPQPQGACALVPARSAMARLGLRDVVVPEETEHLDLADKSPRRSPIPGVFEYMQVYAKVC